MAAMEAERGELNTFLKESGFVRCPVDQDGNCCYLAVLGSLGVLPREEVARSSSNALKAVQVLREMAYESVTRPTILPDMDLDALHEAIEDQYVPKNRRDKKLVKDLHKRADIFARLLAYHLPMGRWADPLALQQFMLAGVGWFLETDIYIISLEHGHRELVATNARVIFEEFPNGCYKPKPSPGGQGSQRLYSLPYSVRDGAQVPYKHFVEHLRGLIADGHPVALVGAALKELSRI